MDEADERRGDETRRGRRRRGGVLRRLLIALLAFLMLVVVGVGGFAWFLNSKVDRDLRREALLPVAGQGAAGAGDLTKTSKGKKLVTGQGTNYLVIGSDARPGETASRSDVIQLVHIPKDRSGVHIIHFPRDLWVPIPGRGQAKINAAYAWGGAPLLVRTVQDLVGVKIDHVAKTDFEGFRKMTDAVGGVRAYAAEGSPRFPQGWHDLDGETALAFVRERKTLSQGDISRGERQQAWMKALMVKTLAPGNLLNPVRLNELIGIGTQHTVVDESLTTAKIRSQALGLRNVRGGDIHFVTAPFSGYGTSADGQSTVVLDSNGMDRLGDALQADRMDAYQE